MRRAAPKDGPTSAVAADWLSVIDDPRAEGLIAYVASVEREIGYKLGYEQAEADSAGAWKAAASRVQRTLDAPSFAELQQRRYGRAS